ncbi:hypothetical protein CLV35_0750 [Motilibacter peucedani]|uniref:Lipoprotein n=1 Tax=Motilibacter peucedani TaxID=598650 RepID=A0A420XTY7_9ACTN|nr:hypothetical protein [Motilibacter peucedani]RKS80322.1 hypothetical protein CLV35_0750 [Motilibacter peucedani]
MRTRHRAAATALAAALLAGCSHGASTATAPQPGTPSPAPSTPTAPTTSPASSPTPSPTPRRAAVAPWGRGPLFPGHLLVGFAGHEHASTLGILGTGTLESKGAQLKARSAPYAAKGRTVVPVFEFLATLVHGSAGKDKTYRSRSDDALVEKYLRAARKAHAVLLLGIQPGRADFLPEVQAYEKWLREPDVGIALDPEWAVDDDELPGRNFGHTTGSELDVVAAYLASVVAEGHLPEKVMVYHQLSPRIVRDERRLHPHKGVVLLKSVDGIGSPGAKTGTYRQIVADTPSFVRTGFKLFLQEDVERGHRLMTPREVMRLRPRPDYVVFE